jgi:hypothetical protein
MRLFLLWIILLILFSFAYGCANYTAAPMVKVSHTSAITRGEPFNPEQEELSFERLEAGVRIYPTHNDRFEFDVTHGRKWVDGHDEQSTSLDVNWFPWGKR